MNISEEICEPGLEEFVSEFLSDRKKELLELTGYNISEVQDRAREIGHKWQGFSRPYGFFALEKLGERLCDAAKDVNQISFEKIIVDTQAYLDIKEETL